MSRANRRRPNRVEVYLSDRQKDLLDRCSEDSNIPKSEIFRILLEEYGEQFLSRPIKKQEYSSEIGFKPVVIEAA